MPDYRFGSGRQHLFETAIVAEAEEVESLGGPVWSSTQRDKQRGSF